MVDLAMMAAALAIYILPTEILFAFAVPGNGNGDNGDSSNVMKCERGLESGQGNKYGLKKNC
jgi:hypothetical protein